MSKRTPHGAPSAELPAVRPRSAAKERPGISRESDEIRAGNCPTHKPGGDAARASHAPTPAPDFLSTPRRPKRVINRRGSMSGPTPEMASALQQSIEPTMNDFKLLNRLGEGGCGTVWRCIHRPSSEIFALKIIDKAKAVSSGAVDRIIAEKEIMKLVPENSPFIVTLQYSFQTISQVCLVMDLVEGGDMMQLMNAQPNHIMSENAVQFYTAELVLAIKCIHSMNVAFRDLKPENVLVTRDGHIKVADFGLAVHSKTEEQLASGSKSLCGTPQYMAPEVILENGHGKFVDLWCLGIMVYEMSQGVLPWHEPERISTAQMFIAAVSADPQFTRPISEPCRQLVNGLLQKEPRMRLGAKDMQELQQHSFFRGMNWDKLRRCELPPPLAPTFNAQTGGDTQEKLLDRITNDFTSYTAPTRTPTASPVSLARSLLAPIGDTNEFEDTFAPEQFRFKVRAQDGTIVEYSDEFEHVLGRSCRMMLIRELACSSDKATVWKFIQAVNASVSGARQTIQTISFRLADASASFMLMSAAKSKESSGHILVQLSYAQPW